MKSDEFTMKMRGTVESITMNGSDATELDNGYISITPLKIDCTNFSFLNIRSGKQDV
jgi:broad specificity polyphosphatase/5'/3'-nucleotidase SurE